MKRWVGKRIPWRSGQADMVALIMGKCIAVQSIGKEGNCRLFPYSQTLLVLVSKRIYPGGTHRNGREKAFLAQLRLEAISRTG